MITRLHYLHSTDVCLQSNISLCVVNGQRLQTDVSRMQVIESSNHICIIYLGYPALLLIPLIVNTYVITRSRKYDKREYAGNRTYVFGHGYSNRSCNSVWITSSNGHYTSYARVNIQRKYSSYPGHHTQS